MIFTLTAATGADRIEDWPKKSYERITIRSNGKRVRERLIDIVSLEELIDISKWYDDLIVSGNNMSIVIYDDYIE